MTPPSFQRDKGARAREQGASALEQSASGHDVQAIGGHHSRQAARFGIVGILSGIVDFGLFAWLVGQGAHPLVANICAFMAANLLGYFLNGWITFRINGQRSRFSFSNYRRFLSVYLLGFALSMTIIGMLAGSLGPFLAKLVAMAVSATSNYILSAFLVFRPPPSE